MSDDLVNQYNTLIGFLIGILTILTFVAGLFKYKWNQSLSSAKFRMITTSDLAELTKRIDDLCTKLDKIKKEMNTEIISAKEEHAAMQIQYQELVKELYKLIGQVTTIIDKK